VTTNRLRMSVSRWMMAGGAGAALYAGCMYGYGPLRRSFATHSGSRNRIYSPIRFESELEQLLILPNPLLANFAIQNDPRSDQLSEYLTRIIKDSPAAVSLVNIEAEEPGVRDLLSTYMIDKIPTVVAIKGGIPISRYVPVGEQVDFEKVKDWVSKIPK
jgi:hypothetical protein